MLNIQLLEILVCPLCKGKITLDNIKNELICHKCKLAYPIKEDIPIMLIDKARNIES